MLWLFRKFTFYQCDTIVSEFYWIILISKIPYAELKRCAFHCSCKIQIYRIKINRRMRAGKWRTKENMCTCYMTSQTMGCAYIHVWVRVCVEFYITNDVVVVATMFSMQKFADKTGIPKTKTHSLQYRNKLLLFYFCYQFHSNFRYKVTST